MNKRMFLIPFVLPLLVLGAMFYTLGEMQRKPQKTARAKYTSRKLRKLTIYPKKTKG